MALLLCGVLHAFTHAYMVALVPLVLHVQKDFGLANVSEAMQLLTVYWMVYCLACLPAGVLADRVSRNAALAVGLALNGLSFVALSYCRAYWLALAAVACAGLAGGLYHPAANALLMGLYPRRPGRAIGLAGMGAALGFAFGPWFAGQRCVSAGWRQPCLELGLAGIVVAVVFPFLTRGPEASAQRQVESPRSARVGPVLWVFALISLMFSLREFGGSGIKPLATVFLQRVHGLTSARVGEYFGIMSLTALIANPLFGALSDGRWRLPVAAGVLVASGLAVSFVPWVSAAYVVVPLAVSEFFLLASFPVVETALAESVPDRLRGRVLGLFITVAGVIGASAPWAMGRVSDELAERASVQSAYAPTFGVLGTCVACSALGLLVLRHFRRRHPRSG